MNTTTLQKQILQKQDVLNAAGIQLKKEFIGIDHIIDEVMAALSSWYLFPDLQEKPVIVNLWGLTGVGKSALIERVAALIRFEEKYYHFDLGNKENGNRGVKDKLEEIYDNANGYPILIALDEFQHARTLDSMGNEIEKSGSRVIWQLLDSGKFQVSRYSYKVEDIYGLILRLRYVLKNGVRVSNGEVTERKDYFIKQMDLNVEKDPQSGEIASQHNRFHKDLTKEESSLPFVPEHYCDDIFAVYPAKFETPYEVRLILEKLNGYETIDFLYEVFTYANSPKTVDCSKSIIFVIGNLDEAYTMSGDFNPDMDADEFHKQSLKINVPVIKEALTQRFRSEQVARLGNNHIIYPALSRNTYKQIIKLELTKIKQKVYDQLKINLNFDNTILELIYKEGVYPTQGTRPLFTTIHQIIKTKLGRVVSEMILNNHKGAGVIFKAGTNAIIIEFVRDHKVIDSLNIPQQFSLEKLRKNKKDDMQAIIAVHEAGHAITSILLMRTLPEVILSNSAGANSAGFVLTDYKWNYISKKEIKNRMANLLGGFAAEKIIFGEENVTYGATDDIQKATGLITTMLKQGGFGSVPAAYHTKHPDTRFFLHDINNTINSEAESWLKSAMKLAENTLKEQKTLLLKMADYLSDHRSMSKKQIKEMIMQHAQNFDMDSIIENGDHLFYRAHLKTAARAIEVRTDNIFELNNTKEKLNNIPRKAVNS